jgi:glycosyltransferase involved in cell wall biosynthesis
VLGSWNLIYEPDRELMTQNGQETGHNSLVQSNRYRFLDGLRGLAALGVVMAHVASHSQDLVSTGIPSGLIAVLYQGKFGVEVLFVISGFVIAHTTRDVNNLRSTFNFLLRRQVRQQMSRSLCLLIPSICQESFGLTAIEAFSTGTPVITTGAGGLSEIVDSDCGARSTFIDSSEFEDAWLSIQDDWQAISLHVANEFEQRYTPAVASKNVARLLNEVCRRH